MKVPANKIKIVISHLPVNTIANKQQASLSKTSTRDITVSLGAEYLNTVFSIPTDNKPMKNTLTYTFYSAGKPNHTIANHTVIARI